MNNNGENKVVYLRIDDIIPNRFQPREVFDETGLEELSESIREHGVIQPIIVRQMGDKYELIAGERRTKASALAGLTTIPAIVKNMDDKESAKVSLLENLQRKNLSAIEEARTYKRILELDNMTQEDLARTMGKSQPLIANKLRLLALPEEVQDALIKNQISERHARSLLNVKNKEQQLILLDRIRNERLTVRDLEVEIKKIQQNVNESISESVIPDSIPNVGFDYNNFNQGTNNVQDNSIPSYGNMGLDDYRSQVNSNMFNNIPSNYQNFESPMGSQFNNMSLDGNMNTGEMTIEQPKEETTTFINPVDSFSNQNPEPSNSFMNQADTFSNINTESSNSFMNQADTFSNTNMESSNSFMNQADTFSNTNMESSNSFMNQANTFSNTNMESSNSFISQMDNSSNQSIERNSFISQVNTFENNPTQENNNTQYGSLGSLFDNNSVGNNQMTRQSVDQNDNSNIFVSNIQQEKSVTSSNQFIPSFEENKKSTVGSFNNHVDSSINHDFNNNFGYSEIGNSSNSDYVNQEFNSIVTPMDSNFSQSNNFYADSIMHQQNQGDLFNQPLDITEVENEPTYNYEEESSSTKSELNDLYENILNTPPVPIQMDDSYESNINQGENYSDNYEKYDYQEEKSQYVSIDPVQTIFDTRGAVLELKKTTDRIKQNNINMESEEIDFDDYYQIIIKIKKEQN